MPRLRALALPAGPTFVEELQDAWDAGDAVLPVDLRLPAPARHRLLDALAPAVVVDADRRHTRRAGARGVDDGDALVVATSGSTGEPKGVVLTHGAVEASARATSARLGVDPGRDHWLACLPLAHVGGLSVVTRALVTGTGLTVLDGFDAAAVTAEADAGATLVSLVATALRRIDPGLFRTIVLGGAAPPAGLPPNVVTTYGMTETGSGVVYDGEPLDGVEVRVTDGEIHLRGAMLLRAYRGPDGERDPTDGDGWFATGDGGEIDAAGRLLVHGRLGDMIVTGGENVWPDAVEAVLRNHPAVAEVAVVGEPDEEWGERVAAHVVPADPGGPPSVDELRDHVKQHLPPWCAPRRVVVASELPRTALGKVRRVALRRGR